MNNPVKKLFTIALLCLSATAAISQSYHAINGSPYAGATGMYTNPANPVNSAYKWDLTLFSLQFTAINTAFVINNASALNTANADTKASINGANRSFHSNADINLLNFHFKINSKSAIAFGLRGRMYNYVKASPFSFNDSISTLQDFLKANTSTGYLQAYLTHSACLEANLNYSRILFEDNTRRLSGGITLGLQKSLSGAHFDAQKVNYLDNKDGTYTLTGGSATAEYSANYDDVDNNTSTSGISDAKAFLQNTKTSPTLSLGLEYLVKNPLEEDMPPTPLNYSWKFGFSLMDLGTNTYQRAQGSFTVRTPNAGVTDVILQQQLTNVSSLVRVRDSLAKSFATTDSSNTPFTIADPTRIVLSVDRNFGHHFFVNGELTINFFSTQVQEKLKTRELNLLTITPRWETRGLGIYLPIQYNTQGQLWVGGAVKLGPLLIGVHSLDFLNWFKTGPQTINGGGYILFSIHPFWGKRDKEDPNCPSS